MSVKFHEAFCLDQARRQFNFEDHFLGDSLRDLWSVAGVGTGAVVDAQDGGIIRLTTGATSGNIQSLSWGFSTRTLLVSKKLTYEMRLKLTQTANTRVIFRLYFDATDNLGFEFNIASDATWHIQADSAGTTDVDTNVAADTSYHIYRIECSPTAVHFYIDGVETANSPITANITAQYLEPYILIWTQEDAAKSMDIDYVWIRQDR